MRAEHLWSFLCSGCMSSGYIFGCGEGEGKNISDCSSRKWPFIN